MGVAVVMLFLFYISALKAGHEVTQELASCEESEKQAKLFEQIGLDYADLDEIEQAISALENSLAHKESIGDGYKRLMSLYNRKRGEAARKGDDQGIDYYMGKMDDMRQIAKKSRSKETTNTIKVDEQMYTTLKRSNQNSRSIEFYSRCL